MRSRRTHVVALALALALAAPEPALAEEVDHRLAAVVAFEGASVRDDLLVPLAQTGGGLVLGAEYMGQVGPGAIDGAVRAGVGVGFDRRDASGGVLGHAIGLRYLLPVAVTQQWQLSVGPAVGADADIWYFGDWDDSHAYWMGTTWLGAAGRGWRMLDERWRADVSAQVAVLGLQGRPPEYRMSNQDALASLDFYTVDVYRDPEPGWIADWQIVQARFELSRTRARAITTRGWRYGFELRVARTSEPALAFAISTRLTLSRSWGW